MENPTKVLRVGTIKPLELFDPRSAGDITNIGVLQHVFEPLFEVNPDTQETEPLLLNGPLKKEAGVSGTVVFSGAVKPGVLFSDGTPLTAQIIADSLNKTPFIKDRADVSAVAERVFFSLKHRVARFDMTLSHRSAGIVLDKGSTLHGTGPYMLDLSSAQNGLLVRNPYCRERVPIDKVELLVYPADDKGHPTKLIEAINQGEVDFTSVLSREEVRGVTNVQTCIEIGDSIALLYFNTQRPVFQDARVRKAVAMAINRKAIAELFFANPIAFTASGLMPPLFGTCIDGVTFDMNKAQALLKESKVTPPTTPLSMVVIATSRPYLPNPPKVAGEIIKHMEALGFKVKIAPTKDSKEYFEYGERGNYDLVLGGWIPDTPDPYDFLEALLASTSIPSEKASAWIVANLSRWNHPPMDKALDEYRSDASVQNMRMIQSIFETELPILPLMYGPRVTVHSHRITHRPSSFRFGNIYGKLDL